MSDLSAARSAQGLDGLYWEGDLKLRRQDESGNWGKWIGPINSTKLAITPGDVEAKNRLARMRGQSGQSLNTVLRPSPDSLTVIFDDVSADLIALAVRGTIAEINETGGTVSAEAVTVPYLGSWIELPDRNISTTGFSATQPSAGAALVAGTDYGPIDYANGWVFIPEGSAVVAGTAPEFSYTHFDVTGFRVLGAKTTQSVVELMHVGKNLATLKPGRVRVWQATLTNDQELDFQGDDFQSISLSGPVATPTGKAEPYEIDNNLTFATS